MYLFKLFVLLACIAASCFGFLGVWFAGMMFTTLGGWSQVILIFWFAAAIAHIYLSLGWLEGRRLGPTASAIAAAVGCLGLLALPMAIYFSEGTARWQDSLTIMEGQLLLVCPAFTLALYLNWYHAHGRLGEPSSS